MILRPRIINYKKIHKKRYIFTFKKKNYLKIGNSGLLLLRPIRLTSTHMNRFKLFLKRATRKVDKTHRFFWFNVFPFIPLTRKSLGARMGKGKGKAKFWYASIYAGINIVEFKNLRTGRARYFMKQLTFKLGIATRMLFSNNFYLSLPYKSSRKALLRNWW